LNFGSGGDFGGNFGAELKLLLVGGKLWNPSLRNPRSEAEGPFVVAFFGFLALAKAKKKHLNRCFFGFWNLEAKNKRIFSFSFQNPKSQKKP
jgi:hypothetical protein